MYAHHYLPWTLGWRGVCPSRIWHALQGLEIRDFQLCVFASFGCWSEIDPIYLIKPAAGTKRVR